MPLKSGMATVLALVVWMSALDFVMVSAQFTSGTGPGNVTISIAQDAVFQCTARPPSATATVTWFMDGQAISPAPGDRRTIATANNATDVVSTLTVANATAGDSATYLCRLDNGSGSVLEFSAILVVLVMPLAVVTPGQLTVVSGGPAMFTCGVTLGTAPFGFQWTRSGGAVIMSGTDRNSTHSSLTVAAAAFNADAGRYRCTVTLDQDNANQRFGSSADGELMIQSPPEVLPTNDLTVLEGLELEVICRVQSQPAADFSAVHFIVNGIVFNTVGGSVDNGNPPTTITRFVVAANRSLHSGLGVCRARVPLVTGIAEANATFTITVLVPPQAIVSPASLTVNESARVVFTCSAPTGTPPYRFQWREASGGDPSAFTVSRTETQSTLTIPSATVQQHNTAYSCNVSLDRTPALTRSSIASGDLTVQILPEIEAASPEVIGVTGRPAKLTLNITFPGRPEVSPSNIVWTKDGDLSFTQNDTAAGHGVSANGLCLIFDNVTTPDDATYTVTACNQAGCVSVMIILEEQRPPLLLETHRNTSGTISVDDNATVTFTCVAAGIPTPNITWQLNGTDIADGVDGFQISDVANSTSTTVDSTLSFAAMFGVVRGNGQYACIATNAQPPQAVAMAFLQVFTEPMVAVQPVDVRIVADNPASFNCTISAIPTPEIVWLREVNGSGVEQVNLSLSNIEIEILDIQDTDITSELTVLNVSLDDLGSYFCQGRHTEYGIAGMVVSDPAFLDVYVSPSITISPQNLTIGEFESPSLFCQASGRPAPAFFWSLPNTGNPVLGDDNTTGDVNSLLTVNSTLSLSALGFRERGLYQCQAFTSQVGYSEPIVAAVPAATASAYVTINVAVSVQVTAPKSVTFPNAAFFSCNASGFPTPTIQWLVPGSNTPVTMDTVQAPFSIAETTAPATLMQPPQLQSVLSIQATRREHNGTYACVARTTGPSMADTATELTVFEVPDAPQAPEVVGAIYSRNLTVTWSPPLENNAPIERYDVSVEAFMFGLNLSMLVEVNASDGVAGTMTTIAGLSPNVNYTVRVRAANAIGDGAFSENLYVATDEDVPTAAPSITRLTPLTNTSVRVAFSPLANVDQNGVIVNYTIAYTSLEDAVITVVRSGEDFSQLLSADISGLDVFSRYAFTVQAHTRIGGGPVSANMTARTLTGFSDPILNPNATVVSSTSIFVEWESAIDTNGAIQFYSIEQVQRDTGGVFPSSPPRPSFNILNSLQSLIEGLLPFTNYTFLITASTGAGNNAPVETSVVRTDEDLPSAVRNVTFSGITPTSVIVAWLPPLSPNGILIQHNYTLEGTSRFDPNAAMHTDSGTFGDIATARIGELSPGFLYTVRVSTATSVGAGPNSDAAVFRTRVGTPSTPPLLPPPSSQDGVPAPEQDVLVFNIEEFPNANGPFGRYHVVVVRLPQADIVNQDTNVLYAPGAELLKSTAAECGGLGNATQPCAYIAMEVLAGRFVDGVYRVAVGNGEVTMDATGSIRYANTPLAEDTVYSVFLRGFVQPESLRRRKRQDTTNALYAQHISSPLYYPQRTCSSNSIVGPVVGAVIGGIVFGILLVLVILFIKRRKTGSMDVNEPKKSKKRANNDFGMVISNPVLAGDDVVGERDETEVSESTTAFKKGGRLRSKSSLSGKGKMEPPSNRGPIPKDRFAKHTLEMQQTFGFVAEYDIIQQLSPKMLAAETCSRPANKLKNRYANIIAYDETRVVLPLTGDDPDSDYINANWLDGYKHSHEFVATQGPVPQSIIDFWRMVWETNASTIAMLTNLEENGRLKCNQYWPTQGGIIYGQMVVTLTHTMAQSHYVVRTFTLAPEADVNKGETGSTREVKQFHFTAWPDHGVPAHPTPLLTFWQRIRRHQPRLDMTEGGDMQPPIIVHCSAGVGRTGTLVVIDAMIAQTAKEGRLDVFNYVMELRRQRNFMVQTETQYRFIHDALVEYFSFADGTEVQVNELSQYLRAIDMMSDGDHGYDIEFKKLSAGIPNRSPTDIASKHCNKKKNRFASFVPFNQPAGQIFSPDVMATPTDPSANGRVTLPMQPNVEGSDYINASFIDSFSSQQAFIATQGPLLSTITDFWTMVWKYECKSIVMLSHLREKNAEQSALYWPDQESDPSSYGDILVTFAKEDILSDFAIRDFTITHTKERKTCTIRQFHYIGWPERGVPNAGKAMLEMVGEVERHQLSTGYNPVVVHCSNGSSRTGTFIAISSSIDRAKSENTVDVFQTVKMMRMQRAGCVQSSDQYMFVYNTVRDYIASFDTYGNFK